MTDQERAMRFGYLLSEIEQLSRTVLDGHADFVGLTVLIARLAEEAKQIAGEISREALDKVTGDG
jgi:hypothetical protein